MTFKPGSSVSWNAASTWVRVEIRFEVAPAPPVTPSLSPDQRRHLGKLYRLAAKRHHPDLGGSDELMAQVNEALANEDLVEMQRLVDLPNPDPPPDDLSPTIR